MVLSPVKLVSLSPGETARLAVKVGSRLQVGDCVLLSGPIGAGKTFFARHLIQSLLYENEDVPSPTFTLVQVYDTSLGELWHTDLYRLNSLDEVEELGLSEAFESAVCLVEWPERLGDLAPDSSLRIDFDVCNDNQEKRRIALEWSDQKWPDKLEHIIDA